MTAITDILYQLSHETPVAEGSLQLKFPSEAIAQAKAQWAEFWPCIEALMQQMNDGEELTDEGYQLLFYGVLLLADVADLSKAPAFFRWVDTGSGLGSDLEYTLGDALTEDLASMMLVLSGGDQAPLWALLTSHKAGELVKASALAALFALREQQLAQDPEHPLAPVDHVAFAAQLAHVIEQLAAERFKFALTEAAIWCLVYGLDQFAGKFQTLARQNKLDFDMLSARSINQWRNTDLATPFASGLVQPRFDIQSISQWLAFQPDDAQLGEEFGEEQAEDAAITTPLPEGFDSMDANELLDVARSRLQGLTSGALANTAAVAKPKAAAGRNDPCPCGSGKKFKKCCGA